ncbi:Uncharacterized protein CHISP_3278 [Chitinispirillum alkaliphilum]|nr:Uncharacterized protein CHISP_3278 [Chitinispirillum alkaliphilum]
MGKKKLAVLMALGMFSIAFAAGDDLSLDALFRMSAATGTFLNVDKELIPASVIVIDNKDIQNSQARDLKSLLEIYVPSYQTLFNRWNGWITSLNAVTADVNTKVLVLIDGREVNTQARDGVVNWWSTGSLDWIDRVEVLEGNAGFVYGSGSIGGVINIIPRYKDFDRGRVSYSVGGYRPGQLDQNYQVMLDFPINSDFGIAGGFGHRFSEGVGVNHSYLAGQDGWSQPGWEPNYPKGPYPAQGSFNRIPGGNINSFLTLYYKDWQWYTHYVKDVITASGAFILDPFPIMNGGWNLDDVRTLYRRNPYGPNNEFFDFWHQTEAYGSSNRMYTYRTLLSALNRKVEIGGVNLDLTLSYAGYDNVISAEDFADLGYVGYPEYDTTEVSGEHSLAFKGTATGSLGNDLLHYAYGLQHRTDFIGQGLSGLNELDMSSKHVFTDTTFYSNALFAEGMFKVTDWMRLHGGFRFDHHSAVGVTLSPKAGVIVSQGMDHVYKLVYQTATNNPSAEASTGSHYVKDENNNLQQEDFLQYPERLPDQNTDILIGVSREALSGLKPEKSQQAVLMTHNRFGELVVENSFSYNSVRGLFLWDQSTYKTIATSGGYNYVLNNLSVRYNVPQHGLRFGFTHNLNRIVNTDIDKANTVSVRKRYDRSDTLANPWYENVGTESDPEYRLIWNTGEYDTVIINAVRNMITEDGKYFLNVAPHLTKFFLDWDMNSSVTWHLNTQLYWKRLLGRKTIYDDPQGTGATWYDPMVEGPGYTKTTWDVENNLSARLNIGVSYRLPAGLIPFVTEGIVELMGHNILGYRWTDNHSRWDRNTATPYFMASPGDGGLFRADQAMLKGRVTLNF